MSHILISVSQYKLNGLKSRYLTVSQFTQMQLRSKLLLSSKQTDAKAHST